MLGARDKSLQANALELTTIPPSLRRVHSTIRKTFHQISVDTKRSGARMEILVNAYILLCSPDYLGAPAGVPYYF
jgi:hypothetical protein